MIRLSIKLLLVWGIICFTANANALAQTKAERLTIANNNLILFGTDIAVSKGIKSVEMDIFFENTLDTHYYLFDKQGALESKEIVFKNNEGIVTLKFSTQRQADRTWITTRFSLSPNGEQAELKPYSQTLYKVNAVGQIYQARTNITLPPNATTAPNNFDQYYYHYQKGKLVAAEVQEYKGNKLYSKTTTNYRYGDNHLFTGFFAEYSRHIGDTYYSYETTYRFERNEKQQPIKELLSYIKRQRSMVESGETKNCVYTQYNAKGDWLSKECDNGSKEVRKLTYYE